MLHNSNRTADKIKRTVTQTKYFSVGCHGCKATRNIAISRDLGDWLYKPFTEVNAKASARELRAWIAFELSPVSSAAPAIRASVRAGIPTSYKYGPQVYNGEAAGPDNLKVWSSTVQRFLDTDDADPSTCIVENCWDGVACQLQFEDSVVELPDPVVPA